ncbi:ester cyclase [Bremerella sp. P1]|uniref:ester cyclase n=1 Tax=Bremerella sp. P1 TaxID=3026424 RepID=UPI002367A565|nr:ester cyclase [Bremerella sp. P1]WDI40595.1 ester cyclase [Bremerella sp. P1]
MVSSRGVRVHGDKFRQLRQACGLTQEEASSKSGYSDRLIRKLERGGPVDFRTASDVFQTYDMLVESQFTLSDVLRQESNKNELEALMRRWFEEVYNQRDMNVIDELMHENVELLAEGNTAQGREAIHQRVGSVLQAFNPLTIVVDYVVCDGNQAVTYWSVTKKHVGPFAGIDATGRWVKVNGSSFAVVEQGQIIQVRDHWDVQDLIDQLVAPEE